MNQLQLSRASKDILDRAEEGLIPDKGLTKAVDDYFIQRLKQDEMQHAEVDSRLYEGLRALVKAEVIPLYQQFRQQTARLRERKQRRQLWQYVLGTVGGFELLEALFTHGRSIVPQVLIPSAIFYAFIGFIIYIAAQYVDDLQLNRARKRLDRIIAGLDTKVQTDVDYDARRQLMDNDVLRAEALEILTQYERPEEFWRDYRKVREADPTVPAEVKALNLPAFERFLRYHVDGQQSPVARQHRFNRLFIEAHEVFLSRDREHYVLEHLKPAATAPVVGRAGPARRDQPKTSDNRSDVAQDGVLGERALPQQAAKNNPKTL